MLIQNSIKVFSLLCLSLLGLSNLAIAQSKPTIQKSATSKAGTAATTASGTSSSVTTSTSTSPTAASATSQGSNAISSQPTNKPKKVNLSSLTIDSSVHPITFTYKGIPFTGTAITRWVDDRIYQEFPIVNGLLNGYFKEYDEKGNIVAQETWSGGRKNGPFQYIGMGPLKKNQTRGYFLNDSLNGLIEGFHKDGVTPKYKVNYNNGSREGQSLTYFDNGQLEQEAIFVNDKPHGTVIGYNRDGKVRSIKQYINGIPNGIAYEFHITGCSGKEMYFKMGLQDSITRAFDPITCDVISEGYYKKGKKHGAFYEFNAFGDTLKIETFSEGVLDGRFEVFKEEWDEKEKKNFLKLDTRGTYKNGIKVGEWKHGFATHLQQREGSYNEEGEMIGKWMFYDNKGRKLMMYRYENGEVVEEKYFDVEKKK